MNQQMYNDMKTTCKKNQTEVCEMRSEIATLDINAHKLRNEMQHIVDEIKLLNIEYANIVGNYKHIICNILQTANQN